MDRNANIATHQSFQDLYVAAQKKGVNEYRSVVVELKGNQYTVKNAPTGLLKNYKTTDPKKK